MNVTITKSGEKSGGKTALHFGRPAGASTAGTFITVHGSSHRPAAFNFILNRVAQTLLFKSATLSRLWRIWFSPRNSN